MDPPNTIPLPPTPQPQKNNDNSPSQIFFIIFFLFFYSVKICHIIGGIIRIGRAIQCLPYAGFFSLSR